jgi:chaperone modulatory protein CbpM
MTIRKTDFLVRADLSQETLDFWIKEEWLVPVKDSKDVAFTEVDLARARLIADLMHELGVNREGVGIILNLLDQVHGMRRALRGVLDIRSEPNGGRAEAALD